MKKLATLFSNPLFYVISLYIITLLAINPFGEFVVNDEWAHSRQVEAFINHVWRIQANTDAVLILQAFIGYFASLLFGFSHTLLKLTSVASAIFLLTGVYMIIRFFELPKKLMYFVLLMTAFNPLIFHLSAIFMTDIPFLALFTWSLFFFSRGIATSNKRDEFFGIIFSSFSVLIRQAGVVPFIAYVTVKAYKHFTEKERLNMNFWAGVVVFALFFSLSLLYPRYSADSTGILVKLTSDLIRIRDIPSRIMELLTFVIYFGFFLSPLVYAVKPLSKKNSLLTLLLAIPLVYLTYKLNVFFVGNILYTEGLYAKHEPVLVLNILSHQTTKVLLSLIIGVASAKFLVLLLKYKPDTTNFFLGLTVLGSLSILLFPNDLYDRYFLPLFIATLLYLAYNIGKTPLNTWKAGGFLLLLAGISVILNYDYFNTIKAKWQTASDITSKTGVKTKIYVNGTFTKHVVTKKTGDFTGLTYIDSLANFLCYTEIEPTEKNPTALSKLLENTDLFLLKSFGLPPKIQEQRKKLSIPVVASENRNVVAEYTVSSPLYSLDGTEIKVVGWCP